MPTEHNVRCNMSVLKDWKDVSLWMIVTFNSSCGNACLKFKFLRNITPGCFKAIQFFGGGGGTVGTIGYDFDQLVVYLVFCSASAWETFVWFVLRVVIRAVPAAFLPCLLVLTLHFYFSVLWVNEWINEWTKGVLHFTRYFGYFSGMVDKCIITCVKFLQDFLCPKNY